MTGDTRWRREKRGEDWIVVMADGGRFPVGDCLYHGPEVADRIVRAVNSHDELVAVLSYCQAALQEMCDMEIEGGGPPQGSDYGRLAERIAQTIAKAKGESNG